MGFISASLEHAGKTFSFYAKEDTPGVIFYMVDHNNYIRLCTPEEADLLEDVAEEVNTIHCNLLVKAASLWESWVPLLQEALQEQYPETMEYEN